MLDIVDSHLHLWDLAAFVPPWLDEVPQLRRTVTVDDWRGEVEPAKDRRLFRAVYVEIDARPADRPRENRLVLDLARDSASPIAGAVIAADLDRPNVAADLAPWLDEPGLKGVRHVLHTPAAPRGACLEPNFIANTRRLGSLDLTFDACVRPGELGDLARLAEAAPETTIVLDHCGNPGPALLAEGPDAPSLAPWRRGFEELAHRPNVVCKLSGMTAPEAGDPAAGIDFCIDRFGEDRVLWASNFPVCDLGTPTGAWLDLVDGIVSRRGSAVRRKLFAANARRVYRLAQ